MNTWLFVLPLTGLVTCALLFKVLLNGLRQPALRLALQSLDELLPLVESKMTDPSQVQEVLPLAEAHIDHFLRHKLTTAMPMVAMFIGDKTIAQFKGVFMEELEQLLPVFVKAYLERVLRSGAAEPLARDFLRKLSERLSVKIIWFGAGLGLVIGLVQLLVVYLISLIV
jgi:hypothetical protein